MTTTTKPNTADLKASLQAAQQRQSALATEHAQIEPAIRSASLQAAKERANAARNGDDLTTVAADLDIEDLRRRRDALPFEIFAQELQQAELAQELHQAELEEAETKAEKTATAFDTAQRELAAAEKSHGDTRSEHMAAAESINMLKRQLREDAKSLVRLAQETPGA